MKILSIETSCDDTAIALVEANGGLRNPQFKVLKNIISSQIKVHRPFGGVVPNLAKREHAKNLPMLWKRITKQELRIKNRKAIIHNSKFIIPKIDAIAVTVGPGLEPALWAGIEFAKDLAKKLDKPLIGVNHMEGHLYSNWLPVQEISKSKFLISKQIPNTKSKNPNIKFPAIAIVVSGGHTILLKMDSLVKWKKLGETRDDAAGEAFDKVARLMNLPYPGGPEIQKIAAKGNPKAINFPRPMLSERRFTQTKRGSTRKETNYEFSFSGLKTAVLYYLRDNPNANKADVAASFQQAVVDVLVGKTIRAAREYGAESVLLCGGVSANRPLRETLKSETEKLGLNFFVPGFEFNTDNAVMIAAAAYIQYLKKKKLRFAAQPNLNL